MKSVISENAGFKYTATLDHVQAIPGSYALTISTTYEQARQPTEARTGFKLTLNTEGLQAIRGLIDDQLNEANEVARQAKDRQTVKIRNCEFAYRCTKTWEELTPFMDSVTARECSDCNKLVHLCTNDDELAEAIRNNYCVALETTEYDNQPMPLGMPKAIDWMPPVSG
jgi:hypothetical protein